MRLVGAGLVANPALRRAPPGFYFKHHPSNNIQLAASKPTPRSNFHNIRGRFSPLSKVVAHFRQNRISFSQCPNVIAGTNTVSGTIPTAHGFS
jgi:hypothetical protein